MEYMYRLFLRLKSQTFNRIQQLHKLCNIQTDLLQNSQQIRLSILFLRRDVKHIKKKRQFQQTQLQSGLNSIIVLLPPVGSYNFKYNIRQFLISFVFQVEKQIKINLTIFYSLLRIAEIIPHTYYFFQAQISLINNFLSINLPKSMLTQPTEQKYTVAQAQIAQFQQKGYTCLRGIIKPENFAHFKKQMNEAIDKIKTKGDIQDRIDDYSNIFTQVTNIWRVDPETKDFILCRVFGDIAAQLLGVDKVRIYHDQALVKFPKAGKTVWHQDCFYWPIDSPKSITMWMPLHDCPKSMGTMQFVSGSHTNEQIILHPISQTSEAYYSNLIKQKNLETESYDLKAGDATFHAGHTVHCAYPNGQLGKREVITIIYFEDGAKVMQEDQLNQFRKVDLKVFCPGVKPEEKIESELNPIIN